jgi:4-hydroxy-tetrahydrodipicolinate synthase
MTLQGCFTAIVTPFKDGRVDWDAFRNLIAKQVEGGVDGILPVGTTGESPTLEMDEHKKVIETTIECTAGKCRVIAGTGANSTKEALELTLFAKQAGADATLQVTPYYNKPSQEGLYRHFSTIADETGLPVMLYNVPGRTAVDMLPATVARLAQHPGIFGIKEATGDLDRVGEIQALCGTEFKLYSGDDATAREFMLRGGSGVVSVTSNVAPRVMAEMCAAAIRQDVAAAEKIDQQLFDLHRDLFVESNPIPVKWALERMGMIPGGLRLPLTRLIEMNQPVVEAALAKAGLV